MKLFTETYFITSN